MFFCLPVDLRWTFMHLNVFPVLLLLIYSRNRQIHKTLTQKFSLKTHAALHWKIFMLNTSIYLYLYRLTIKHAVKPVLVLKAMKIAHEILSKVEETLTSRSSEGVSECVCEREREREVERERERWAELWERLTAAGGRDGLRQGKGRLLPWAPKSQGPL